MKKLWLLLALLAGLMHAQVVGPGFVNYVTSAPSGTCSSGVPAQIVMGAGTLWTCQSGTWKQAAGGSTGAPGGSDTQVQFNDSGSFGGNAGFTFVKTGQAVTVGDGTTNAGGFNGTLFVNSVANRSNANGSTLDVTITGVTDNSGGAFGSGTESVGGSVDIDTAAVASSTLKTTATAFITPVHFSGGSTGTEAANLWFPENSFANGGAATNYAIRIENQNLVGSTTGYGIFLAGQTGTGKALAFGGSTSGIAVLAAQAAAGTPTLTLPTASGTFADSATAPLALSATTGALSITGAAGQVLAGASPAFTATPSLGTDNSVAGTLQMANGSANAHTIWSSGATTSNTIAGFTVAPTTGDLVTCTTASTTCTLTDSGIVSTALAPKASPTFTGTVTLPLLATTTNCAATGTSANPSVVSCSAAPAGAFACATNASTGTCQVNTTAVTTSSRIFIQPTAAANSLTCNATADTGLTAPRLLSQSNGASFTINLGTFATTALCFNYWVVN